MPNSVLNSEKAIVVFSGGQDSTTCLFYAKRHFKEVELVTFNYGQRHNTEIEVASKIAKDQGLKHHILDMSLLSQLTPNALTKHDMTIATGKMVYQILLYLLVIYYFIICWGSCLSSECETHHYWCM